MKTNHNTPIICPKESNQKDHLFKILLLLKKTYRHRKLLAKVLSEP